LLKAKSRLPEIAFFLFAKTKNNKPSPSEVLKNKKGMNNLAGLIKFDKDLGAFFNFYV
jgi:hypothetical protein